MTHKTLKTGKDGYSQTMEIDEIKSEKAPLKYRMIFPVFCILIGLGLGAYFNLKEPQIDDKKDELKKNPVQTLLLKKESIPVRKIDYGTVQAWRNSFISSEVQGRVLKVHPQFREGLVLNTGTTVLKLDVTQLNLDLSSLRSDLQIALNEKKEMEVDQQKNKKLVKIKKEKLQLLSSELTEKIKLFKNGNLVSKQELNQFKRLKLQEEEGLTMNEFSVNTYQQRFEKMNSRIEKIKVMIKKVQDSINKSEIKLPFSGRLQSINIEVGMVALPGQKLFTLVDDSRLEVPVPMLIEDIEKVFSFDSKTSWYQMNTENKVRVLWEDKNVEVEGVINRIDQKANGKILHHVVVQINEKGLLRAGQFVKVIFSGRKRDVLQIPKTAVYNSNKIYLLKSGANVLEESMVDVLFSDENKLYIKDIEHHDMNLVTSELTSPHAGKVVQIKK